MLQIIYQIVVSALQIRIIRVIFRQIYQDRKFRANPDPVLQALDPKQSTIQVTIQTKMTYWKNVSVWAFQNPNLNPLISKRN